MIPNIFLHGFLDDHRQIPFTYCLAALQLALLVAALLLKTSATWDLRLILLLLANVCLAFQLLFLWRIVTHKLGDGIHASCPTSGACRNVH